MLSKPRVAVDRKEGKSNESFMFDAKLRLLRCLLIKQSINTALVHTNVRQKPVLLLEKKLLFKKQSKSKLILRLISTSRCAWGVVNGKGGRTLSCY